jgi:DNA-binding Lrp family transcriptional regulator
LISQSVKTHSYSIDSIDRKILELLARDSSLPTKKIADSLGVTRQTVSARISRLEKSNVIRGYRAKIDYEALGYSTFFLLFLKIGRFERQSLEKALQEFRSSPHVLLDVSITGEWDVMQLLAFRNTAEYDQFISNLRTKYGDVFKDTKSHAILKIFKFPDDFIP